MVPQPEETDAMYTCVVDSVVHCLSSFYRDELHRVCVSLADAMYTCVVDSVVHCSSSL